MQRIRAWVREHKQAVLLVAAAIGVLVLLVLAWPGNNLGRPSARGSAASHSSVASSSSSHTASKTPETPPDQAKMRQELATYVTAFYHIDADPARLTTTVSRQTAVTDLGFVSPAAQGSMDCTVYTSSALDQIRISQRLVEEGTVDPDTVQIAHASADGRQLYVISPVSVKLYWPGPDHRVYSSATDVIGTVWQWQPVTRSWLMTAYGKKPSS